MARSLRSTALVFAGLAGGLFASAARADDAAIRSAVLTDDVVIELVDGQDYRSYRGNGYLGAYPDSWRRWADRHRRYRPPSRPGLRYFRRHHDYSPYEEYRRTHPQTYRGQFGEPGDPPSLVLRHYRGPGLSPFSRDAYRPYSDREALPEFVPPGAEPSPYDEPTFAEPAIEPAPREPAPRAARQYEAAAPPAPGRAPSRVPAVSAPSYPVAARPAVLRRPDNEGWALLARGRAETAQYRFSSAALAYPRDMTSRAGYALASAVHGHHERAIWTMRRAFRLDPTALAHLPIDEAVEPRLRDLLDLYLQPMTPDVGLLDAMFMRAALLYILGEDEKAEREVRQAIQHGDVDRSTLNLLRELQPHGRVNMPGHRSPDYRVRRPDLVAVEASLEEDEGG